MRKSDKPRKLRADLSPQEREKADGIGSIEFKSTRRVDMRVEPFIPSKDQH